MNNNSFVSLCISLHIAQLVPLSVFVSVDNARMLTHPDDSSTSAFSRLISVAHSISQQIHISMTFFSPCASGHPSRDLDWVVLGDDFIVAGCGDDPDRLPQKLNEKLEVVQKAAILAQNMFVQVCCI